MANSNICRLAREIEKMTKNPSSGISCYPVKADCYDILEAHIIGPKDTPYEGGVFVLDIQIPPKYPFEPPQLKFLTPVYHPNIDNGGRICLDLMKLPPKGSWRPTISIEALLIAVQGLLAYPNPEDPLMADIAKEFQYQKEEYERKARECTQSHAILINAEKSKKRKTENLEQKEPSMSKKAKV